MKKEEEEEEDRTHATSEEWKRSGKERENVYCC
jgi:hypothetical protein